MTRRQILLASIGALAACRSVSPAPPGTPPLVVETVDHVVAGTMAVGVRWEAQCDETWSLPFLTGDKESLSIGVDRSKSLVSCNEQGFSARVRCNPGPCTIVKGLGGTSRTLEIAFGALGKHTVTLVIDNGSIEKTWTSDVEVVIPDAIRIGCSVFDGEAVHACEGQPLRRGALFRLTAAVFAGGRRVPSAAPRLETTGLLSHDGQFRANAPGTYVVRARFDGLLAELILVVEP